LKRERLEDIPLRTPRWPIYRVSGKPFRPWRVPWQVR